MTSVHWPSNFAMYTDFFSLSMPSIIKFKIRIKQEHCTKHAVCTTFDRGREKIASNKTEPKRVSRKIPSQKNTTQKATGGHFPSGEFLLKNLPP